jgi:hypothetical protein
MNEYDFHLRKAKEAIQKASYLMGGKIRTDEEHNFVFNVSGELVNELNKQMELLGVKNDR